MEDVTEPELIRQDPQIDRAVCLYGFVRGTHFKNSSQIHVPGTVYLVTEFVIIWKIAQV